MRIFVTGATGFIGSAVVQELLKGGHEVLGLARSDEKARALGATGAKVHRGDLQDLACLRKGAESADGVIHLGFIHDFSKVAENCEIDRKAIEAIGSVLAGSERRLVVTGGVAGLKTDGGVATESDRAPFNPNWPRVSEQSAFSLAQEKGVRAGIVRLAPSVYGEGPSGFMAGFVTLLIEFARTKGVSAYVGEGQNRWPAIHRLDAASLYRLAVEKGAAGSTYPFAYHGVAGGGVSFKDIAAMIGKRLNVPVASLTPQEASQHFGWFAPFASLDAPTSNQLTRERLGWKPAQPGLIDELERAHFGHSGYTH